MGGEFAEQILAELIAEGLSGEALLSKFKAKQAQIRPVVGAMLSDAEDVAESDFTVPIFKYTQKMYTLPYMEANVKKNGL